MKIEGLRLTGIKLNQKTTNENNRSAKDCANLWEKFQKENISENIPGKLSEEVYAVYYEYEGDHTKPFSYFIGCRVTADAPVPDGMTSINIPRGYYKLITAKGKMPDCIANTWKNIWKSGTIRAYNFDFEVYDAKSRDPENAEVNIYIGV